MAQTTRASLLASAIASMLRLSRFDACSIQGHRPHRGTRSARQDNVTSLHEPRSQILVSAFGDLPQDRAIPGRLLCWHEPQPCAKVASLSEAIAVTDRRHHTA